MPPEACCRPLPRLTTPLPHTPLQHRPPDRCAAAVYAWHPRRSPSPAAQAKCDELCLRNGYATTLAALVSALRRLSHLSSASAPLYRCLSAEAAGAAWHGIGTSQLTCTSGAVTALLERSACLVASAHAAARRVVGRGGTDAAAASLADDERASREQYWATQRMLDAAEAVARHPDGGAGGAAPTSNLGGRPAGVVDRSATSGGRDGACLLRIEPSGTRISADLNFISQRPLTPTSGHIVARGGVRARARGDGWACRCPDRPCALQPLSWPAERGCGRLCPGGCASRRRWPGAAARATTSTSE